MTKKNIVKTILSIILILFFALFLWSLKVLNLKEHYPYFDFKKNEYAFQKTKPAHWLALKDISQNLQQAIIVSEDWAFYEHEGIDYFQLKLVLKEAINTGELSRGASTITAQLVKNTLLNNDRSILRKIFEYYYVFLVEKILTKNEILEKYLNIIELGPKVYGIKNGAHYYFKKKAKSLGLRESAFLAFLLPSPVNYSISFAKKELTPFAQEQIKSILIKLRQNHFISDEQRLEAMDDRFSWEEPLESPIEFNFYGDEDI